MALMTAMCCLSGCAQSTYRRVGVEGFEAALSDTTLVLLDVRTAQEYAQGHIAGARNIDVMRSDFERRVAQALAPGAGVALYCRSGQRSRQAAALLRRRGRRVVELSTGFLGWISAGKPVSQEAQ